MGVFLTCPCNAFHVMVTGLLRALISFWMAVGLLIGGSMRQPAPEGSAPTHFRWSIRRAHELSEYVTLANANNLSPEERSALVRIVEAEVRPFMEDQEIESERELHKLVLSTRVELIDLNGDGVPEVFLQPYGIKEGCSGTGNCTLRVFEKTLTGYKKLLDKREKDGIGGIELVTVEVSRTNGYLDLTLASHDSTAVKDLEVVRFDKTKYVRSACYVADWEDHNHLGEALKKPVIFRTKC